VAGVNATTRASTLLVVVEADLQVADKEWIMTGQANNRPGLAQRDNTAGVQTVKEHWAKPMTSSGSTNASG